MSVTNYCHGHFSRSIGDGAPLPAVIKRVVGACLEVKPFHIGKASLRKKGVSVATIPIAVKPLQLKSAPSIDTAQGQSQVGMRKGQCIGYHRKI